jgi:predicted nucleic-acid-binding Zn-ribbon protein
MANTFRLKQANKVLTLAAIVLLLSVSCTPGSCFEETEAYLKASFYTRPPVKLTAPDSLTVYGEGRPLQKIYDRKASVQPALIPLNSSAEISRFVIKINGVSDTLEVRYTSFPSLISKECGYSFFHDLDTVFSTRHSIDSIKISLSRISNTDEENIRIYF